nr:MULTISPECIES: iron-containing alcohol dehydrogenase [unclassified Actinopolyspora]
MVVNDGCVSNGALDLDCFAEGAEIHTLPVHAYPGVGGQSGYLDAAITLSDKMLDELPDVCVAVGGGSVLDVAKLAVAAQGNPWLLDGSLWRNGPGMFPVEAARKSEEAPALVAVPTMPGSAAHVSDRVCLAAEPGRTRRLVYGRALLPDDVVVDTDFFDTLDSSVLLASICEALYRELGPFLITRRSTRRQDRIGAGHVAGLLRLGETLLATGELDDRQRAELERLSSATMRGGHRADWMPASHPWWCIQNSVLTEVSATKGALTARGMPNVLTRVEAGDERFGTKRRLRALRRHMGVGSGSQRRLHAFFSAVDDGLKPSIEPTAEATVRRWAHDAYGLWADLVPGIRALGVEGIRRLLHEVGF